MAFDGCRYDFLAGFWGRAHEQGLAAFPQISKQTSKGEVPNNHAVLDYRPCSGRNLGSMFGNASPFQQPLCGVKKASSVWRPQGPDQQPLASFPAAVSGFLGPCHGSHCAKCEAWLKGCGSTLGYTPAHVLFCFERSGRSTTGFHGPN